MTVELSDADLLLRLTNFEDAFAERKTSGDSKDWLKTVVGFANSAPVGYPAVLYIGVKDRGEVEHGLNLNSLQKSLSKKLADAYPPIYYLLRVLAEGGHQFLAVIVPGSESRPHFAGPSYVRAGSETLTASETQFRSLIAQRQSKAYELLRRKGKQITVDYIETENIRMMGRVQNTEALIVEDCNQHYVSLRGRDAIPLYRAHISSDNAQGRLRLEVLPF